MVFMHHFNGRQCCRGLSDESDRLGFKSQFLSWAARSGEAAEPPGHVGGAHSPSADAGLGTCRGQRYHVNASQPEALRVPGGLCSGDLPQKDQPGQPGPGADLNPPEARSPAPLAAS